MLAELISLHTPHKLTVWKGNVIQNCSLQIAQAWSKQHKNLNTGSVPKTKHFFVCVEGEMAYRSTPTVGLPRMH